MAAVSCAPLTKVVVRFAPFHRTTEAATKLLPFTVSVAQAPPALALLGERGPRVGAELLMAIVSAAEVAPPGSGLNTVADAVPAATISAAAIAAVSCVLLTNVVGRAAPF